MTSDNSNTPPPPPSSGDAPPPPPPGAGTAPPAPPVSHDLESTGFQPEGAQTPAATPAATPAGHDLESTGWVDTSDSAPPPPPGANGDLTTDSIVDERYRVEEKLGEGGMGSIYLVKDLETRENLALKTLSPALRGNAEAMKTLAKEVATARQLSHSNLLRVHTLETRGELPYLVMEYVDGGDLDIRRRQVGGKLTEEETCTMTLAVLDALEYLHGRGFVHLDVKPQNVMLTKDGQAKLTDYGIAKSMKETNTKSEGTPLYMAPELIRGEPTDRRTDVYAVGVMFYYLLMGRFPFGALRDATPESVREWHLAPEPDLPGLPEEWRELLLRCLARDAADRFASCAEVIVAIEAVRAGVSESAETEPPKKSSNMPMVLGIVALLAIGGGAAFVATQGNTGSEASSSASNKPALSELEKDRKHVQRQLAEQALLVSPADEIATLFRTKKAGTDEPSITPAELKRHLDGGLDPNGKDDVGVGLLQVALISGGSNVFEFCELLVKAGAKVEYKHVNAARSLRNQKLNDLLKNARAQSK